VPGHSSPLFEGHPRLPRTGKQAAPNSVTWEHSKLRDGLRFYDYAGSGLSTGVRAIGITAASR
jgi:hypothetical protein